MKLGKVEELARSLMRDHGLSGWDFTFDRAKRRAGCTDYGGHTIKVSAPLAAVASESEIRDVILHEIAHARVGYGHHHDAVWKAEARKLGATPRATLIAGPSVPAPYIGTCPHGHYVERFRRPRGPVSCAVCAPSFRPEFLITWTRREQS